MAIAILMGDCESIFLLFFECFLFSLQHHTSLQLTKPFNFFQFIVIPCWRAASIQIMQKFSPRLNKRVIIQQTTYNTLYIVSVLALYGSQMCADHIYTKTETKSQSNSSDKGNNGRNEGRLGRRVSVCMNNHDQHSKQSSIKL